MSLMALTEFNYHWYCSTLQSNLDWVQHGIERLSQNINLNHSMINHTVQAI